MLPIGRVGLAGAEVFHDDSKRSLTERGTCNLANGDLYSYPNASSTVDGTQPVTFTWNTDCSMSSTIDLYLYAPSSANGLVRGWTGVDFSAGKFSATLNPSWWNSTTSAKLYLSILNSGAMPWDTHSPAGPVFTVNYPASALSSTATPDKTAPIGSSATASSGPVIEKVSTQSGHGISKGAIAAAVIVPIVVIAAVVAIVIRFYRVREKEKRRRWSQAMSSHSNLEWEKGARPGEKPQSILGRPSLSSFQSPGPRPASLAASSVLATENNMAGYGTSGVTFPRPEMGLRSASSGDVTTRGSVIMPDGQVRQSRISFADVARPDRRSRLSLGGELRPTVSAGGVFKQSSASRSASDLHTPRGKIAAYASGSAIADEDEEINISPSQLQGPNAFADSEMKRVGQGRRTGRRSILSLGGDKNRRDSTASALSADDFKSAASARGSVDELRDMEAVMLMRRSMMSQRSGQSPATATFDIVPSPDTNHVEALDTVEHPEAAYAPASPPKPTPSAGSSTVAYGPDQMLAVYAARGKVNAPSPSMSAAGLAVPKPAATRQNSGMRLLTSLGKRGDKEKDSASTPITSPAQQVSSPFDAFPTPAPSSSVSTLTVPSTSGSSSGNRSRSNSNAVRQSAASGESRYSEGNEEEIGNAR